MGLIARQGSKQAIVKMVGLVVGFISILAIYPLELESYGFAAFILSAAMIITPLFSLGVPQCAIKFFPEYVEETNDRKGFIWTLLILQLIPIVIFTFIFYAFSEPFYRIIAYCGMDVNLFRTNSITIGGLAIILVLFMTLNAQISNYGRIVIPSIISEFGYKVYLPLIIIGVYLGYVFKASIPYYIIGFYSFALVVLILYMIKLKTFGKGTSLTFLNSRRLKRIVVYGLFSTLSTLGALLAFKVDTVMVTGLLGAESAGLYLTVLVMATVIDIPGQAIGKIAGPIISKAHSEGDRTEIETIYKKGSINSLIFGIVIFLGIWFNFDSITSLSSDPQKFIGASSIFLVLGVAKLIDGLTSINTHIILYSDYYRYNLLFLLILGLSNVFLNLVLIDKYGLLGAAMASLVSLSIYNLVKYIFIKVVFKMQPLNWNTIIVIALGVLVYAVLTIIPMPSVALISILLRSVLICVLFIGGIYLSKVSLDFNNLIISYITKIYKPIKID